MNVSDLMTKTAQPCNPDDSLQRALQIMREHNCGVVPVVDSKSKVLGMITYGDASVAAHTQGRPLWQIPVSSAMAKQVDGVREDDDLGEVEALMRRARVRRVLVLNARGCLKGMLSLNDLARDASTGLGPGENDRVSAAAR